MPHSSFLHHPPLEQIGAFHVPESRTEIPIEDCREPLVRIPDDGTFVFADPHPYEALWAPYPDEISPFSVREWVLRQLQRAAILLDEFYPWYRLKIVDAYRPLEVQAFMVEHVAEQICLRTCRLLLDEVSENIRTDCIREAYKLWARPNPSLDCPPPHSTGAVIDLTIVDDHGNKLDMWSRIDEEIGAHPDYFADSDKEDEIKFHKNRELLRKIMEAAVFTQLEHEWWHFSSGDQYQVWRYIREHHREDSSILHKTAHYGRWLPEYGYRWG